MCSGLNESKVTCEDELEGAGLERGTAAAAITSVVAVVVDIFLMLSVLCKGVEGDEDLDTKVTAEQASVDRPLLRLRTLSGDK